MRIKRDLPNRFHPVGKLGKFIAGYDCLDARKRQRLVDIDRFDPGVSVRAAQDLAVKHPGKTVIGAVLGASGDLVNAVMADRTCSDDFEVLRCRCSHGRTSHARSEA